MRAVVPSPPVRTCVGCRVRTAKSELVRLVLDEDRVVFDETGSRPGRGAHLHLSDECLQKAIARKAFNRAFRGPVVAEHLYEQLKTKSAKERDQG